MAGEEEKILVLIPARYGSTRFPGKPLAKIAGRPLIQWVFDHCQQANGDSWAFEVAVVTDSPQIEDCVLSFGGQVISVKGDLPSGSDRVHQGWKQWREQGGETEYRLVVNVQGDEPQFHGEDLRQLVKFHLHSPFDVATMVSPQKGQKEEWANPHRVKVAWNPHNGHCFYFSRSPIPFHQPEDEKGDFFHWWLHIGVYSYKPQALETFRAHPVGNWEKWEKLEQLRSLEAGLSLGACEIKRTLQGIDVPEDILLVESTL